MMQLLSSYKTKKCVESRKILLNQGIFLDPTHFLVSAQTFFLPYYNCLVSRIYFSGCLCLRNYKQRTSPYTPHKRRDVQSRSNAKVFSAGAGADWQQAGGMGLRRQRVGATTCNGMPCPGLAPAPAIAPAPASRHVSLYYASYLAARSRPRRTPPTLSVPERKGLAPSPSLPCPALPLTSLLFSSIPCPALACPSPPLPCLL